MDIHHILAPTDFSVHANQAVTSAFELAQTWGAKLSLLHIIEVPVYAIEVALPLTDLEQEARRALARLLPEALAAHVEVTRLVRLDETSILSHRACVTPARRKKCAIFPGLRCTV